jgi:hypothetical protein
MLHKSLSLLVLGLLLNASPAFAQGHAHDGHHQSATQSTTSLEQSIQQLETMVASKQLKQTHDVIESATKTLEATTPPATQKERFEGAVRQLKTQLNALHTAADAGDQPASESAIKKVRGAYKLLQATLK